MAESKASTLGKGTLRKVRSVSRPLHQLEFSIERNFSRNYFLSIECILPFNRNTWLVKVVYSLILFSLPTGQLFLRLFLSLELFLKLVKAMSIALRHNPTFDKICA